MLTSQQLITEVADEIEHLTRRPTSEDRCLAAIDRYLDEQSAENFASLRNAYDTVPEHLHIYLLGGQDAKDWPLRQLITLLENVWTRRTLMARVCSNLTTKRL